ncbi:uncharacterized protein LACBIDRAFT_334456 [Laccaria bicolor S238N-H82]|uniref:Predicted protein n=1 Tax=Laccaria bicolor (strain S238N-H82 / ATCC MYA-4686) TaxID=486041 RepID=B0DZ95_LACBS|nr:uncharacterized protein LACBIDRAFT_334456 [Laccaria bicolor S238N-H82]EDR00080.1 predicted protein [Laccaria bicolor S238N-H82]|eukprot:XP_001889286.1 predicted protein [Laccaria bicolor S238N-H82]
MRPMARNYGDLRLIVSKYQDHLDTHSSCRPTLMTRQQEWVFTRWRRFDFDGERLTERLFRLFYRIFYNWQGGGIKISVIYDIYDTDTHTERLNLEWIRQRRSVDGDLGGSSGLWTEQAEGRGKSIIDWESSSDLSSTASEANLNQR